MKPTPEQVLALSAQLFAQMCAEEYTQPNARLGDAIAEHAWDLAQEWAKGAPGATA